MNNLNNNMKILIIFNKNINLIKIINKNEKY
jgi:hypothetical protein